ncbi:MAG: DUF697 domain-containing protein [Deltaproteobacteria bacterium]|nr:DUF697 domain-containing protein [Deltaproteobacteria bacterium]
MSWLDRLEEVRKNDWAAASLESKRETAREVVDICSYAGSLTSLVPIPIADLALLVPVHSVMVMTIGHVYGRKINETEAKRIAVELGAVAGLSFAGSAAISAIKKLLMPGLGSVLGVPATFALTWGLGRASIAYFENPNLSRDDLQKVFDEAVREGKATFSKDAFDRFRKKQSEGDPNGSKEERSSSNEHEKSTAKSDVKPDQSTAKREQAPKSEPARNESPRPESRSDEPKEPSLRPRKRTM